jgi:serine protease Do
MAVSALLAFAGAQDSDLKQALALEKRVQKVIAEAEPSIACILVSRSELYARFGQGSASDPPGRLGVFDAGALRKQPLFTDLSDEDQKRVLKKLDLADANHVPESAGSGIIVDEAGLVLTPYHVVQGATKIFVCWPGGKGSYADIHAGDPRSDLAVLRLLRPKLKLKAIACGDGGKLERGHFVIGLAHPFVPGLRNAMPSAAWGLIANLRQRIPPESGDEFRTKTIHQYRTLVQTDARMNLGTSGGVLLNLQGEAVALTTTLAGVVGPDGGGSLAVPLDAGLQRIINVLKKGEEVEYGFLGVGFERAAAKVEGVALASVTAGSPAEQAGLKTNHVILDIDGQPVNDTDDLLRGLSTQLAGSKIRLEVRKPGSAGREKVDVVLARYLVPGKVIASHRGARPLVRGLRVDFTSLIVQQPGFTGSGIPRGVLVSEVVPGTAAAKADLKPGLIIAQVNGRAVTTPAAFYEFALNHKGPLELTLLPPESGQPAPKVSLP